MVRGLGAGTEHLRTPQGLQENLMMELTYGEGGKIKGPTIS